MHAYARVCLHMRELLHVCAHAHVHVHVVGRGTAMGNQLSWVEVQCCTAAWMSIDIHVMCAHEVSDPSEQRV